MRIETHSCTIDPTYGDWRLHSDDINRIIDKSKLTDFLVTGNLKTVPFDSIAFKQNPDSTKRGVNCSCCGGDRYTSCNTSIPGILSENCPNTFGKTYRMLDGKHRIQKLIDEGKTEGKFFVIQYDDIKEHFVPIKRHKLKWRPTNA